MDLLSFYLLFVTFFRKGTSRDLDVKNQSNKTMLSFLKHHFHFTLVPGLLVGAVPHLVVMLWYTIRFLDGSLLSLYNECLNNGALETMKTVWSAVDVTNPVALITVFGFMIWSILLHLIIPGDKFFGPVTPQGNVPEYKDNGFRSYLLTMALFAGLTYYMKTKYEMSPTLVYDHFGDILAVVNLFSLVFCLFLYLKGRIFPSSTDNGSSGNFIFDYYWGTELYPRVFGIDLKTFTNCRFGMTAWPLLCTISALKNYEVYGFVDSTWVSWILYMSYFTKFFWWEAGYMRTIDIAVDRAGFYLCWGCLVFIPGLYASPSFYLASHPVRLGEKVSMLILCVGFLALAINYLADKQKQDVRAKDGKHLIWGKQAKIIRAKYTLKTTGREYSSILLASGYWGVSRHFHYLPELILAFSWSVPALFDHLVPYLYLIVLFMILVQRTYRDDDKCSKKYGRYWKQYCEQVPYKILPPIF